MLDPEFTFAICAYKESPYIEDAIISAEKQTIPVKTIIATSTPSEYLREMAKKHEIEYIVNPEKKGIASDWNFALKQIKTPFGAIMHQDDIYFPKYAEKVVEAMTRHPNVTIAFTDYCDLLCDGKYHPHRMYLWIKRFLLWPFYLKHCHGSVFWKRSVLIFGNAISCPAVSYNMKKLGMLEFDSSYSVNLDWAQWLTLADREGAFAFIPRVLMAHRIDENMETSAAIADNRREKEDFAIFERVWGKKTAEFMIRLYRRSYSSNKN